MQPILTTIPSLAVSLIYCIWSAYRARLKHETALRERVAYMLWVAAAQIS